MSRYHGQCHCGAVKFEFTGPEIDRGLRCNCSYCRRKGAIMTEYTVAPEDLIIDAEQGALGTYQFGKGVARHHFCTVCGIYPFHATMRVPDHYRVNLGCIDALESWNLPCVVFDGSQL